MFIKKIFEKCSFLFFSAKKRNRKSSPLRINLLKFYRLRWTKINSLRSDSIFVLTAQRQNFLTRFLRGGRLTTEIEILPRDTCDTWKHFSFSIIFAYQYKHHD